MDVLSFRRGEPSEQRCGQYITRKESVGLHEMKIGSGERGKLGTDDLVRVHDSLQAMSNGDATV